MYLGLVVARLAGKVLEVDEGKLATLLCLVPRSFPLPTDDHQLILILVLVLKLIQSCLLLPLS